MRSRKHAAKVAIPTALVVIKAIALAGGHLKGHPNYMTKLQMIALCQNWLVARRLKP